MLPQFSEDKKNVLFMPSWYPTKENPINGSFFKEQTNVLTSNFNIVVLHYTSRFFSPLKYFIFTLFRREKITILYTVEETKVPEITVYFPIVSNNSFMGKVLQKCKILPKINKRNIKKSHIVLKRNLIEKIDFTPNLLYAVTAQVNAKEASSIAHYFNIPYVVAEHCPFPLPQTAISTETKEAIENANCIISISRDKTRQMLIQGLKFESELVGNMVDENLFTLPQKKDDRIFTILIVAANNFYKDYPTFFKTMRYLKKICNKPFKILIVGFNPVAEKTIWNEGEDKFRKMIAEYGLLDISELVPKAARSEMPTYYHKADVFVMTSIQEGFPVSCLEATCCGLPVYSTRCGGVEDFIDDENGKLVNIQDYEKLAINLNDLIEGRISYNAEHIRKKTVENYGKKAFLNKVSKIFDRTIEEYGKKNNK